MKDTENFEVGVVRSDIQVSTMRSVTNAKRSPTFRGVRSGKGSTSGNRELTPKQAELADNFYAKTKEAVIS